VGNKPANLPVSGPLIGGLPRPFPWQIVHQEAPTIPKTKTHPDLGGEIGGQFGVYSLKKPRSVDFWITVKSGHFTGFSGR